MTDAVTWNIKTDKNGELNVYARLARKNADGTRSPIDLTGKTLRMQVRQYEGATGLPYADVASTDSSGDRIAILDAVGGRFWIHIGQTKLEAMPDAPMAPPPAGRAVIYRHDLKVGAEVYARGTFTVLQGVTR